MSESVFQLITDRITTLLEKGVVPWHQPWKSSRQAPQNLISGKRYRGVNVFLLNASGFSLPYWLTFNQANHLGGHVKKGEKGFPVVFWKWLEVEDKDTGEKQSIPFLRFYTVFNVAQCEGIEVPTETEPPREHSPVEAAEAIVAGMPQRPEVKSGMDHAYYSPRADSVGMPAGRFQTEADYYSTLFHELTHSTGHQSRLNRRWVMPSEIPISCPHCGKPINVAALFGAAGGKAGRGQTKRALLGEQHDFRPCGLCYGNLLGNTDKT